MTLSLTAIKNKAYYCNGKPNNGGTNCDINFADAGFFFSYDNSDDSNNISNQIAGLDFSKPIKLDAFYNDRGQCKNIFKNNESVPIKLGIQCQEPNSCSALDFITDTIAIGKNKGSQSINYQPVDLKFNQNGTQIDAALYQDAGKINLIASYTINDNRNDLNGLTIKGQSNQFAVRPYKFKIKATRHDGVNGAMQTDLTARDNNTLKHIHKAGDNFTFEIQALNANSVDTITQNYIPNSNNNLQIKLTRSIPLMGSFEGAFTYASNKTLLTSVPAEWVAIPSLAAFDKGVYEFVDSSYSEVGAIQINVKDTYYYGMTFFADATANSKGTEIGRFTPAYFELKSSSVDNYIQSVGNNPNSYDHVYPDNMSTYVASTKVLSIDGDVYQCRPEWNNSQWCPNPGYKPGVIDHDGNEIWSDAWILLSAEAAGFTYMDQPELGFSYRLESQNSFGVITKNYDGDINADVIFSVEFDGLRSKFYSDRLKGFGGVWREGVYEPELSLDIDKGRFARLANAPDGPIMNTFFGIGIVDADGVLLNDTDMFANTELPAAKSLSSQASELRYGRWNISDGYGPINDLLPVAMQLEYFDGQQFIINPDDSVTEFASRDVEAQMQGSSSGINLSGSGRFIEGESQALLISSKNPGKAILEYINTPPWLQYDWTVDSKNPTAIITFGFFYGNDRVIYRRRLN